MCYQKNHNCTGAVTFPKVLGTAGDDNYAVYLFNLFHHGYNTKIRIG